LRPGYGFGGPCFPRDNRALGGYAKMVGVQPLLPEATDLYNKLHTGYQIDEQLALNKEEYVFTGIGYKDPCPVNIIEESQKLVIAQALARAGKRVVLRDRDYLIKVSGGAGCCCRALSYAVRRQPSWNSENFSLMWSFPRASL
jgi:UDP-glucose 6-dehydrogenase